MKKENFNLYQTVAIHALFGAAIGFFVLHPISMMIIACFEPHQFDLVGLAKQVYSSGHLPMGVYFSVLGALFGAVYAFHFGGVIIGVFNRMLTEKALRATEEKYHAFFLGSRDAMLISTLEGNIVDVNPSFLELFGYTREEVAGLNAKSLYPNPDDRLNFRKRVEEGGSVKDFEVKLRKKDGTLIDAVTSATVRRSKKGRIEGLQGILHDVTEKKRTQAEKEKLISDLQEALAKVKTLSGMLPICAHCKKIRDDKGYWKQIEAYVSEHSMAEFSHGICPECLKQFYPAYYEDNS